MTKTEGSLITEVLSCDVTPDKTCDQTLKGMCSGCEHAKNCIKQNVHKLFGGGIRYSLRKTREKDGIYASVKYPDGDSEIECTTSVIEGLALYTKTDLTRGKNLETRRITHNY